MSATKTFFLIFFMLSYLGSFSQEICNNGIDDDGNGLIDMNDSAACFCNGIITPGTVVTSLIPNPSFENMNCCPSIISMMSCADGWIQASTPTTDYLNTCGFVSAAQNTPGILPFPNGNGCVATIFRTGWSEYVGACLVAPMQAGQSYTMQFNIAASTFDGWDDICNNGQIFFGPVDITLYGSTNCGNMPFNGTSCPPAPAWQILGSANYTPVSNWGILNITFTPSVNIEAIILGGPCQLPPSYDQLSCFPYIYYDNLILNTTTSFNTVNITPSGNDCTHDVVFEAAIDTNGGTWQWYRDGNALPGETQSTLNISSNGYGAGEYAAVYSIGGLCQVIHKSYQYTQPALSVPVINPVTCFGGTDGSASALLSGTPPYSFAWNTTPVQNSSVATNLPAGMYTVIATDGSGCTVTSTITVNEQPPIVLQNPQSLCGNSVYQINGHFYDTDGTYLDTMQSIAGCDSVIITQLETHDEYLVENPISLCFGESFHINAHQYNVSGSFYDTLQTITGCDSIVHTQLVVKDSYLLSHSLKICEGESLVINGHSYHTDGLYADTMSGVNGCDSIVHTQLTVLPLPVLSIREPDPVCRDASPVTLDVALPAGGIYSGEGIINNTLFPGLCTPGSHLLTYSYSDPLSGCTNRISKPFTVHDLPSMQMLVTPRLAFIGNSRISYFDFSNESISWSWDFGDGSQSDQKTGEHVFSDTGRFEVSLSVIDNNGCRNSAREQVIISENFSFYVPNAFTPNGDGINDSFRAAGQGINEFEMVILNRWGEKVFETNNMLVPWNGISMQEGIYIYKISITDGVNNPHEFLGYVTLLR